MKFPRFRLRVLLALVAISAVYFGLIVVAHSPFMNYLVIGGQSVDESRGIARSYVVDGGQKTYLEGPRTYTPTSANHR